nr:autotransporter-associated beta strand repeat-containing protein [Planctomycetota bacterium]
GLTKAGTNVLTLSGVNTYTGATTVSAGTLTDGAAGVIADTSAVTVASGATWNLANFNETVGSLAGAGSVTLGSATLTCGGDATSTTLSGVISGTGAVTKAGAGTMTLSGVNTYTGATTVSAGTLTNGAAGVIADTSAVTVASGATWNLANFNETVGSLAGAGSITLGSATLTCGGDATSTTLSGVISGTGAMTKAGAGTMTLSGVNTYTGVTTVSAGTLTNGAAGVIADTSAVTVASGAIWNLANFNETVGSLAGAGSITLGSATLTCGGDATSTTLSGVISGTGAVTKAGAGTMTLSGVNTYTGATTVSVGTVLVSGSTVAGSAVTVANGATLGGTGTVAGTVALAAGSTLAPGLGGTAIGTLTTGSVTCNATSTFSVDLDGTTPTNDRESTTGTVACAGTLTIATIANAALAKVYTIVSAGTVSGTFSGLVNGATFTQQGRSFQIAYTGTAVTLTDVARPTTRVWDGGGADNNWTTAANWDFDLAPSAGDDLQFAGATRTAPNNDFTAATSFASITFNSGASAFTVGGNAITLAGAVTNSGTALQTLNLAMSVAATRTVDAASGDLALGGVVSGVGGLTKAGTNVLTLTGASTYTGATTVSAGTLLVSGSTAAGSAVGVSSGATLGGTGTVAGTVALAAGSTLAPGLGGTAIGTLTTGSVTCNATSILSLDLNGTTPTNDQVTTSGTVACAGTLTIASIANAALAKVYTIVSAGTVSGTFSGLVNGAKFTQQGRTFQIAYTGTTVTLTDVARPTTRVWDGGGADNNWTTAANWDFDLAPIAGDDLQFAGATRTSPNNDFTAATSFASITFNSGASAFTVGGNAITLAGAVTNSGTALQTLNLALAVAGTRTVDAASGNLALGGVVSGVGGLTKASANVLTLSGVNTYTGATTVSAGTLLVSGSTVAGSAVSVSSGATLGGTGTVAGTVALAAGSTLAPGLGGTAIGTLTTGSVTCNASSTFAVDLDGTTPTNDRESTAGTVACAGTLTIASIANAVVGKVYTIVSAGTVSGTFSGLATNAVFTQAGRLFRIAYTATAVTLTDFAPVVTARQTLDADGNGRIDRIRLTFDLALNDDTSALTVTVAGYAVSGFATGAVANDNQLDVLLTESGAGDTGATPAVRITANTSLMHALGAGVVQVEGSATAATDSAAPVLLSTAWTDGGTGGVSAGDTVTLTFSESVTAAAMTVADLGLPVTSDTLSTTTIANQTGSSITMTLAGSPRLTPGGTYSAAATGAGKPSGVFVASGAHLLDAVGLAPTTGNAASARDLGPGTSTVAIAWATGSDPRTWALGTMTVGTIANSLASGVDLTVLDSGDCNVDLSIASAATAPSSWGPAASAGANAYLMKAGTSAAASGAPTNPASYALTLTTTAQALTSGLLSGATSAYALYFQAPTSISSGSATQQTIVISITAALAP